MSEYWDLDNGVGGAAGYGNDPWAAHRAAARPADPFAVGSPDDGDIVVGGGPVAASPGYGDPGIGAARTGYEAAPYGADGFTVANEPPYQGGYGSSAQAMPSVDVTSAPGGPAVGSPFDVSANPGRPPWEQPSAANPGPAGTAWPVDAGPAGPGPAAGTGYDIASSVHEAFGFFDRPGPQASPGPPAAYQAQAGGYPDAGYQGETGYAAAAGYDDGGYGANGYGAAPAGYPGAAANPPAGSDAGGFAVASGYDGGTGTYRAYQDQHPDAGSGHGANAAGYSDPAQPAGGTNPFLADPYPQTGDHSVRPAPAQAAPHPFSYISAQTGYAAAGYPVASGVEVGISDVPEIPADPSPPTGSTWFSAGAPARGDRAGSSTTGSFPVGDYPPAGAGTAADPYGNGAGPTGRLAPGDLPAPPRPSAFLAPSTTGPGPAAEQPAPPAPPPPPPPPNERPPGRARRGTRRGGAERRTEALRFRIPAPDDLYDADEAFDERDAPEDYAAGQHEGSTHPRFVDDYPDDDADGEGRGRGYDDVFDDYDDEPLDDDDAGYADDRRGLYDGEDNAESRRRKAAPKLLIVLAVVALLLGGGIFAGGKLLGRLGGSPPPDFPGPGSGAVTVTVPNGATSAEIADALFDAGVIKSVRAFVTAAIADPDSTKIQPGTYQLKKQMAAKDALTALLDPKNSVSRFTIPEGTRVATIVAQLTERYHVDPKVFQDIVDHPAEKGLKLPDWNTAGRVEGYLFPTTYDLDPKATPVQVLQMMVDMFNSQIATVDIKGGAARLGLTPEQIVTVASIIEAEVPNPNDGAQVAEVIYNRLKDTTGAFRTLGMDSTTRYVVGKFTGPLTDADLANPSPYNTRYYKSRGIPPGAIDNPGLWAIKAALNPAQGTYKYFVAMPNGETKFATTEREWEALQAEYRNAGGGEGG